MAEKRPPAPDELSAEELSAIRTGHILSFSQLGLEWRDDHEDCVAVRVHFVGREPIDVSLWWCGPTIIGALRYCGESSLAKMDILELLRGD